MSLLTPPKSSHRTDKEKENKFVVPPLAGPSTRSVIWASKEIIHSLATPLKPITILSKLRPATSKSILKASSQNTLLSVPADTKQREVTPEPSDPLADLHYLDRPVEQILSSDSNSQEHLAQLIEGYNVLAARLRVCVPEGNDADATWPLFQPLRKNTQPFVNAVVRDLGRALVDPLSLGSPTAEVDDEKRPRFSLPSPQKSPIKKKGGLTAEQVKFARDLCTTCHSIIKLLSVMLSLPAIYNIFEQKQLSQILTAVLAIPLAEDLPTPNARKTCALAIWLLQVQRLPSEVLGPASSRIAYALRRGIDGELGKEGKKGSANDGLRAIHDLCVYMPAVFVPAFTPLLPSVLSNLLAHTLALRAQACHALGGFVNGATSIATSTIHTKLSRTIATYLTTATVSPTKAAKASANPTEAAIIRTLRSCMASTEPTHIAQGPIWAICVLASFVVLLGSRLCVEPKLDRIVSNLLSLGMRHPKSSIRGLTCVVWRPIAWTYFQPPLPVEDDEESEVDEDSYVQMKQARLAHCKVMLSVVDCQAGVSTIAALLGDDSGSGEEALRLSVDILQTMASHAGHTCKDAVETMRHMVDFESTEEQADWDFKLLLPSKLFSANPGLLTSDFKALAQSVRPVFDQLAMISDIRRFTKEEMAKDWVFRGVMLAWRAALGCLELCDDADVPDLVEIWMYLLKANVIVLQEKEDDDATSTFGCHAVKYINHVLEDPKLNFVPKKDINKVSTTLALVSATDSLAEPILAGSDDTVPDYEGPSKCTNGELRVRVAHRMWTAMRSVFPRNTLRDCADALLASLMRNEEALVHEKPRATGGVFDEQDGAQERDAWVALIVDVLSVCDADAVKTFWGCEDESDTGRPAACWGKEYTNALWKAIVAKWKEMDGFWEGGVVLLGIPFTDKHSWSPSGEDFTLWEEFLGYTTSKALDSSVDDSSVVLDSIASFVSSFQTPGSNSASGLRLVDLLFSHLDAPDMRDLPSNILGLASETMRATYPPEPRNKQLALWMLRSLAAVIEHCPDEFCFRLLEVVQEGLCLWLSDEFGVWSENEMAYDVITLYHHCILRIQTLPNSFTTLDAMTSLMDSIFRYRTPAAAVEAFNDYWNVTYAQISPPEEGWSGSIRHCLVAVGILPAEGEEDQKIVADNTLSSPLLAAFVAQPSTPRTPVSSSFSSPSYSIVRREALSKPQSPQRPQKLFGSFPAVPSTPPSPVQARRTRSSSTTRTPLSAIQSCSTPTRRRRVLSNEGHNDEEKENMVVGTLSVAERIAGLSSTGKKRRHEDGDKDSSDGDEPAVVASPRKKLRSKLRPRPSATAKKARNSSPAPSSASVSSNESEDERWVVDALMPRIPFPSMCNNVGILASDLSPRRTRGERRVARSLLAQQVSEAEQPADRDHATSLDSLTARTPMKKIDLTKVSLRRAVSIPEALLKGISQRKRKRSESDVSSDGDVDLYDLSASDTPLPALLMAPRQIKRTCNVPLSDDASAMEVKSSDDDPHLGQVTPHHLISPALARRPGSFSGRLVALSKRRAVSSAINELFGDDVPGSDDSVATSASSGSDSDSPTKGVVTRQMQRTRSYDSISRTSTL